MCLCFNRLHNSKHIRPRRSKWEGGKKEEENRETEGSASPVLSITGINITQQRVPWVLYSLLSTGDPCSRGGTVKDDLVTAWGNTAMHQPRMSTVCHLGSGRSARYLALLRCPCATCSQRVCLVALMCGRGRKYPWAHNSLWKLSDIFTMYLWKIYAIQRISNKLPCDFHLSAERNLIKI